MLHYLLDIVLLHFCFTFIRGGDFILYVLLEIAEVDSVHFGVGCVWFHSLLEYISTFFCAELFVNFVLDLKKKNLANLKRCCEAFPYSLMF